MRSLLLFCALAGVAWSANFTTVIGDKDGFGLGVAVGAALPATPNWDDCCYDFRDAVEKAATDGSEQTDVYSAGFNEGYLGPSVGLAPSFTLNFPFVGTLTSATLSTFAAGLQQQTYTPLLVTVNGIGDATWLHYQDGETATAVHSLVLTSPMIAAANASGKVTVTIAQQFGVLGGTPDFVMFDYFQLDGATSSALPAITSLSPSSATAGSPAFTLTVNGSNFVNGSVVEWNGVALTTQFVSGSQLTVTIPAGDIAAAGQASVTVVNPGAGGGTSAPAAFTINPPANPPPSIISLFPSSAIAGSPAFTLTVNGANFVAGSVVDWNGVALTTQFVSGSQLTATVPASDIAIAGTANVTVMNPAAGGTSGPAAFTIKPVTPPQPTSFTPTITWVLPVNTTAGSSDTTLTVSGAYFVPGSTVRWNGVNLKTSYVNANQLQVVVPAADLSVAGSASLTIAPNAPQSGSNLWAYPITSPGVTTFAAAPQPVGQAPVASAIDPVLDRIYAVHRELYRDVCLNAPDCANPWPSNVISVVDLNTQNVIATIGIGSAINGDGQGIAVDSTRHLVYVTNADDNTVTVIDGASNTTLATTTVDASPEGIAVDPDTGIVYVAAANVTLLDAGTGAKIGSVPVGGAAWAIALDRASHLAYALVNSAPAQIVPVNGKTQTAAVAIALAPLVFSYKTVAVDPGSRVYASDYNTGLITPIDVSGAAPKLLANFSSGIAYPVALAVDPVSHFVYIAGGADTSVSGSLNIFNASGVRQNASAVATLRLPTSISIASGQAYIANAESDSLTAVNTTTLSSRAIPLGAGAAGLALDAQSHRLYAANFIADALSIIDTVAKKPVASWSGGAFPWSVAVDAGLQQVYAVNSLDGSVGIFGTLDGSLKKTLNQAAACAASSSCGTPVVKVNATTGVVYATGIGGDNLMAIDGRTNRIVATIPVGATPVGVAIDETANRVYVANQKAGTISIVDGAANTVIATWTIPSLNNGANNVWKLAIDPPLKRLYVSIPPTTVSSFTGLLALDTTTGAVVASINSESVLSALSLRCGALDCSALSSAEEVAVNPATHHVFLSDSGNGTVMVIDGFSGNALKTFVTGTAALGLAVDSTAGLVYASNIADTTIGVFADQAEASDGTTPPVGTPAPVLTTGGVVGAGNYSTSELAPGGIGVAFGSNMAITTTSATTLPLPTELAGISVLVNGYAAPLFFVSSGQINFLFPWEVLGQTQVTVIIVVDGLTSTPQTISLPPVGPAIFPIGSQGAGDIENANTGLLALPAGSVPGLQTLPVKPGDYLAIFCAGLGDVTNRPRDGVSALGDPLSRTILMPTVSIGGVPANVTFSGLTPGFAGLYQVNAQVPDNAPVGDAVTVTLTIGGVASNTVTIAIQPGG